jgi:tetratricopeptide (TPR) repeat protein
MDEHLFMQKRAERNLQREMQSTTPLDSSCARSTKITKNRPKRKLLHLFLHSIRLFGIFAAFLFLSAQTSSCEPPPLLHLRRLLAWEADRPWVIEAVFLREEDASPRLSLRLIELPEKKLDELSLDSTLYRGLFYKAPSKDGERILREILFRSLPALRRAASRWAHWQGQPLRWQWLPAHTYQGDPAPAKTRFQWKRSQKGLSPTSPQEGKRWIARRVPLVEALQGLEKKKSEAAEKSHRVRHPSKPQNATIEKPPISRPIGGQGGSAPLLGAGQRPAKTSELRRIDEMLKKHLGEDLWFVAWPATEEKAAHWRLVWMGRYLRELDEIPINLAEDTHLLLSCAQGWCLLQADMGRASKGEAQITQRFAWEMAPHLAFLVHLRGYQAHEKRRYDLALADFSLAARLDPRFTDAHYNQACAHALRGESAQAMAILRPLLAKHPSYRKLACRDTDLLRLRKDPRYQGIFERTFACLPTSTQSLSRPTSSPAPKTRQKRPHKSKVSF